MGKRGLGSGDVAASSRGEFVGPLPFVDEHGVRIDSASAAAWSALIAVVRRTFHGGRALARVLGCDPVAGTAEFSGLVGEAVPGFRVAESEAGRRLVLRGRHRFAEYALTFEIDGEHLRARTHAAFPGLHGKIYRALVIGSGAHRLVTRRILLKVARAARLGSR